MDVAFAIVILRRRESEGGRGKKSGPAEGWRMTGSALKRWTLYWDCFSERIYWKWEGVQGEGGNKSDRTEGKRIFLCLKIAVVLACQLIFAPL